MKIQYAGLAAALAAVFAAPAAYAAEKAADAYPSKPIRMLVPFSAGSVTDILARMLGQKMTENWHQQVVVDNRPSAGGIVASQTLVNSTPDGYTLMTISSGHSSNASLYSKLPYDTVKDFAGVAKIASIPNVLVVSPTLGPKNVKDLIAFVKAKPGQLNFASAGIGSATHMTGEQFKLEAGLELKHVPYKGTPEALTDTMQGRVQYFFAPIVPGLPFIKDNRLLALAVTTKDRSPVLPNVPTVAEAGIPGFEFDFWIGVVGPVKLPKALKDRISQEYARILALPDIKERMLNAGATPAYLNPERFDALIKNDVEKLGKIVRAAKIQVN
jgi:tripartite-type tricarboxylate transporter receptor subunit TctC